MKSNDKENKCGIRKNKKTIIFTIIIIAIILIGVILLNKNNTQKIQNKALAENENDLINLELEIKDETDESYKCLLTFTSYNEDEKIKSIEYPSEEEINPQVITVANTEGKEKIGIDYELKKEDIDKTFKITTVKGNTFSKRTGYTIYYEPNGGQIEYSKQTQLMNFNSELIKPTKEGYFFLGWSLTSEKDSPDYKYYLNQRIYKYKKENGEDIKLYAKWISYNELDNISEYDSIIANVKKINNTGVSTTSINNVQYSLNTIIYDGDLVLDGTKQVPGSTLQNNLYEFGNKDVDVAKENGEGNIEDAQNMVVLKVNGNLTINEGITLTSCKSDNGYGGPKGLLVYCTGTLINKGTIDMTARGARAQGQDVYLWQNINDNSYEYVPAIGANGGNEINLKANSGGANGNQGEHGENRATGGGGSGAVNIGNATKHAGGGSQGTSYSGGTGGGGAGGLNVGTNAMNGENNGRSGGFGIGAYSSAAYRYYSAGGGSGNPGGAGDGDTGRKGENGTGGLLIIYGKYIENYGSINSNGTMGGYGAAPRRKFRCRFY